MTPDPAPDPAPWPAPGAVHAADRSLLAERRARRADVAGVRSEARTRELAAVLAAARAEIDERAGAAPATGPPRAADPVGAAVPSAGADATLRLRVAELRDALAAVRARVALDATELADERATRTALEAVLAGERTRFAADLAAAEDLLADARTELEQRTRTEEDLRATLGDLRGELDAARSERAGRAAADAAHDGLVAGLVAMTAALRAGVEREVAALTAAHAAQLERERAARAGAEAELAGALAARDRAEARAAAALASLTDVAGPRFPEGGRVATQPGPLVPPAGHPALARSADPRGPSTPPAVVVDLTRAMERLRAADERPGLRLLDEPAGADGAPPPEDADAETRLPVVVRAAHAEAPPPRPWLAPALAALDAVDPAAAERLLLAALVVQAGCATRDVAYGLELPATGEHAVRVVAGGEVRIAPGRSEEVEVRLQGSAAALAPLAGGAAPRRLPGVAVRGRRRRLRRLLRALAAPVGLTELEQAGARPRPGDLLALLCLAVPAEEVRGSALRVAYVVEGPGGARDRTLVRAQADGGLTVFPGAPDLVEADATVTTDAPGLLAALAGTATVTPVGDARAVATLQRWLRTAQQLPS